MQCPAKKGTRLDPPGTPGWRQLENVARAVMRQRENPCPASKPKHSYFLAACWAVCRFCAGQWGLASVRWR
jgi:hypothetical protein